MHLSFVLLIVCAQVLDVYSSSWCVKDSNCNGNQVCKLVNFKLVPWFHCVDLCVNRDSCGVNAYCIAQNHREFCTCKPGYSGRNPRQGCSLSKETITPSCEGRCGLNTNCEIQGNRPLCFCKDGFTGNPYNRTQGCTETITTPSCEGHCGLNANCEIQGNTAFCSCRDGFTGNPQDKNQGCREIIPSCEAHCGSNTNCKILGNKAFCGCKDGFAGNPYNRDEGCRGEPGLIDAVRCWSEDRDNPSHRCVQYFIHRPKKQFFIMQDEANWFEALKRCEVENRMLAIIENRFDQNSLEEQLIEQGLDSQKVWLAGSDLKKRGRFQWVAGSTFNTIKFTNWQSREPRDNRHCVALGQRFSWVAEDCSQSYAFVCQNK